jgi:hypothetical protein
MFWPPTAAIFREVILDNMLQRTPEPIYVHIYTSQVGQDSSISIATGYGMDGPGIESWRGARFSAPIQTGPGAHPASYAMGTGSFLGVKR